MNKIFTLVKATITAVLNYEKDRTKDHWRVNVMINIYDVIIYIWRGRKR